MVVLGPVLPTPFKEKVYGLRGYPGFAEARRRRFARSGRFPVRANFAEIVADPLQYPLGSVAISIRVPRRNHGAIGSLIREEPRGMPDNGLRVRAGQESSTGRHALGALGGIAHHKDRLA